MAEVVDLYAGPGGWDEGLRRSGITDVIGIEWDAAACATAEAAGHKRLRADVAAVPLADFAGATGLVASPPCQAWSMAGKRAGEVDRAKVHALIDAYAAGSDDIGDGWADDRSHHAAQPVRWVRELRPWWVIFEQVPPVLGLWRHCARVFRGWGYTTWTGVLNSADYGVPQTRQRAVLIAVRGGPALPPDPTHAKVATGPDLFGPGLPRWVSMAEALGWGMSGRPSMTVTGGGSATGGAEPFGNAARQGMHAEADAGRWQYRSTTMPNSAVRDADEPAPTIAFGNDAASARWVLRNNTQENASTRDLDEPAGTLFFGARGNDVSWVLHTNRGQRPDGTRQTVDPQQNPAPTVTGESGGQWVMHRPAITVQGDPRIGRPGHKDRDKGESQFAEQSVRVTVQEAAILQSFPPDYPWQGSKTKQFEQVGNAVPPRLAEAIIRSVTERIRP